MRISWIVAFGLVGSGCSFQGAGSGSDGGVVPDGACLEWAFLPAEFSPCAIPRPGTIELVSGTDYTIDSGTGIVMGDDDTVQMLPHAIIGGVGVISVSSLLVPLDTDLVGIGNVPLVIASWDYIAIDGTVDVSSDESEEAGPGIDPVACAAAMSGLTHPEGDGGGGGGGFRGGGGAGGTGGTASGLGGSGGMARAIPMIVAGGCSGASAPDLTDPSKPSPGGFGGGAVALIAHTTLLVTGIVTASGGGGGGGQKNRNGGGGGGSGGMIKLESLSVTLAEGAIVAANGGQGGGGANGNTADSGVDGGAQATRPTSDNHESDGTNGGSGGYVGMAAGEDAFPSMRGGGGGGGGVGVIVYKGHVQADLGVSVQSPLAQPF